jgi:hypothetical protein
LLFGFSEFNATLGTAEEERTHQGDYDCGSDSLFRFVLHVFTPAAFRTAAATARQFGPVIQPLAR